MADALYFVWRFSDDEPYRVYGTRNSNMPAAADIRCIWRGDDMETGRQIAKDANAKLREKKSRKRRERIARNKSALHAENERVKMVCWNRGIPKEGGTIFGK